MAIRRTRGPELKKLLTDKLTELAPGVLVTYGMTKNPEAKWIMVGNTSWPSSQWVTNRSREEQISVTIVFNALCEGGSAMEAEQTAIAMSEAFEDWLFKNPGLGTFGAITSTIDPTDLKSWPLPSGFEGQYEIEVVVTCRP